MKETPGAILVRLVNFTFLFAAIFTSKLPARCRITDKTCLQSLWSLSGVENRGEFFMPRSGKRTTPV
jgi:hypothetical protein